MDASAYVKEPICLQHRKQLRSSRRQVYFSLPVRLPTLVVLHLRTRNVAELNETELEPRKLTSRLHEIMCNIHSQCVKYGTRENGYVDYVKGANIAGFLKVANAMLDMGVM
jgi:hypothetical protein